MVAWQFNREFYCIVDHDAEVGCVGFLFYGISNPMFIGLSQQDIDDIQLTGQFCETDMQVRDRMQNEMLRTLLKRVIISVTRLARKQTAGNALLTDEKLDLIRKFNLLLNVILKPNMKFVFTQGSSINRPRHLLMSFLY
ncbi:hypothetical protein KUH03_39170 [Sphingobacterium sp. E70]|uniref:hypothetical protein n=1 Tax=Sphingobacterium sp. E70 TaxID=2853439 RepID=UPI00211CFAEB|nr:hypothetical protein [Sphingobacterium sp. E70]ULT24849.1 hypothetical protein KUH03_39170 [Sphingobacterium sp. E70]